MRQLEIVQDQLDYVGLLAAPAFRLFSDRMALASGLYHAFQGYHSGVDSVTFESDPTQPLREVCEIDLDDYGAYKVTVERIEWTRLDAWTWALDCALLARGDAWLRSLRAGHAVMHSHYFTYTAHATTLLGVGRDLLLELGAPALRSLGESDGTGLIYHARLSPGNHPVQLTIDHSHEAPNGVYLELIVSLETDLLDYEKIGSWLLDILNRSIGELGLQVITGRG
jgi:hypothetical protein